MLSLFDFAISVAYNFLSAMKNNSVNLYPISKGVFKPRRIKNISSSLSIFNCMKDMHRLYRVICAKKKKIPVKCSLLCYLPMAMDSPEIKGEKSLKPINPRNLLLSSNQGQNNMQLTDIK